MTLLYKYNLYSYSPSLFLFLKLLRIFLLVILTFSYLASQCYKKFSLLASSLPSAAVSSCSLFLSLNLTGIRKTPKNTSLEWKWRTDSKDLCWSLSLLLSALLYFIFKSIYLTFILPAFLNSSLCAKTIFCRREIFVQNRYEWKCIGGLYRPTQMKQDYFRNSWVVWVANLLSLNDHFFTNKFKADNIWNQ